MVLATTRLRDFSLTCSDADYLVSKAARGSRNLEKQQSRNLTQPRHDHDQLV
jgi:hypothetical protein